MVITMSKNPPFDITGKIIDRVMDISELMGKISSAVCEKGNPTLRKANRIRTIQGSLAIEQNSLSLEQVTAVINGKHIIAPPREIAEVKNAYEIYEHMDLLDPYSIESLLKAHEVMMRGLSSDAGAFRSHPVGVVDSKGNILHFGTLPDYVPKLMNELFKWVCESDLPMLIKSCVFHYEFELIHPFSDGNGRIGRLWHTLLLSKWNTIFEWLPIESIISEHQQEYYEAINISNIDGNSTKFIEFMLSVIYSSLIESSKMSDEMSDDINTSKASSRKTAIMKFLKKNEFIANSDVCKILNISPATANRILRELVQDGELEKVRKGRLWAYVSPMRTDKNV